MAIEITFGVRGKETTQALYIQESEWEIPLSKLRKTIEDQSLYVPLEYKFLSLKDNAIAHPAEENIVLKEIVSYAQINHTKDDNDVKQEEFGMASEIGETIKKIPGSPKIWIAPLKVNFSSSSPNNETTASGTGTSSATENEGEGMTGSHQDEDEPFRSNGTNAGGQRPPGRQCPACPYKVFLDFLHGQNGSPNPKSILKILFLLAFVLFTLLATMTLTLHVMVSSFTSISRSSAFDDLFSKLGGEHVEPSEIANLQMKLSQLEVSSKYEIEQLTSRLAELEDLYLRDLAIHKKELNLMKKQMMMAEKEDVYSEDEMNDFEENDLLYERNNKEPKRKSGGAKINDRTKG